MLRHITTFLFSGLFIAATPSVVEASPWTLPKGDFALSVDFDFQSATNEYLGDGDLQRFPLNAEFRGTALRLGTQYGFTDQFEGSAEISFKSVTYNASPVIIGFNDELESATRDQAQASITDFSNDAIGAADAVLRGRYNLFRGVVMVTNETALKLPTGYTQPRSTLDDDGNIADDVTLGDGQADLENSILFGAFIPASKTFARLGAGFRFRFSNPGHQVISHVKVGQFIGSRLLLFVGGDLAITVVDGEPIGQTIQAQVDNLQPEDVNSDSIAVVPSSLDKDLITVSAGVLFLVLPNVELQASFNTFIFGRNVAQIRSLNVGTSFTFPGFTTRN